jgi:3-hydroxyacyl-[acyl-carrier-protein] dehydratase
MPRPEEIIPHRPPFLFVDEVFELVPNTSARARWTPPADLDVFRGHFPEFPVLPGVLLVEAIAQLGAIVALATDAEEGDIPLFGGIDKARFRRAVRPGDVVDLEVELTHRSKRAGKGQGRALVDGELACETGLFFLAAKASELDGSA